MSAGCNNFFDTSPVQPLETGMQMMRVADSRWPESLQQQQASTQWNEALKTRAQSSPQLRGWLQTRQDLHAFADLVMQREKEGLTLSYIKNVIWQAERGLGQETPVESLLTQYHDARAQKQNTDTLEKQINERLEGVLSRWLLLKNNVMPEAATGTTPKNNYLIKGDYHGKYKLFIFEWRDTRANFSRLLNA